MFAHNVFTVDFLWGRLPLYIVAIYPMMATVAYEIVRMLGVFRRRGVLVGAICVGFVHHAFYEIFDHLGPQLRWWEWTLDHPMNQPFFDSVPLPSVVVFAALWPMSLAFCVRLFVGRHVQDGKTFSRPQLVAAPSSSVCWRRSEPRSCPCPPRWPRRSRAARPSGASCTPPNSWCSPSGDSGAVRPMVQPAQRPRPGDRALRELAHPALRHGLPGGAVTVHSCGSRRCRRTSGRSTGPPPMAIPPAVWSTA